MASAYTRASRDSRTLLGSSAIAAAAQSPARSPATRRPSAPASRIAAIPAAADGRRNMVGESQSWIKPCCIKYESGGAES